MPISPQFPTGALLAYLLCLLAGCGAPVVAEIAQQESAPAAKSISEDWPTLFGPRLDSLSRETALNFDWPAEGPPELWRASFGTGYSSPVVAGGKLILLQRREDEEIVTASNADTGQLLWEHRYPTRFKCRFPPYSDGPYSTPLVVGDLIYSAGAEGRLHCLRLENGSLVWECDLAERFGRAPGLFGFGAGLWVEGGRLFVNAGGVQQIAGIVALDAQTGETLWTATDHQSAYTTPRVATIHGVQHLFVLTETGLVSLDPTTGAERWTYPFHSRAIDTVNAVTPVVVDDRVLIMTGPGPGAVCLQILPDSSHEVVWQHRRTLDSQFNNVLVHQGYVYGFTSSQEGGATFRCVRLKDGKLLWSYASILGRGSSLGAQGKIILLGEQGHLGLVDLYPQRLTPRSLTKSPVLAKPCYSAPALAAGRLYVRNEREVICYDLRATLPLPLAR